MQIEIWSDVICPFCGLGSKRLENALSRFAHAGQVTVKHRSFELHPSATPGRTKTAREMLRRKYGLSDEQIEAQHGRIEAEANAEGIVPYVLTDNQVGNTALVHELLAFASDQGLEQEAWDRVYRAYWSEVRDIFTPDALVELATEIGLDPDGTRAVLSDRRYRAQVVDDMDEAQQLGATGVPFIVIDRRYGIAGAQPLDVMLQTIERAWQESQPALVTVGDDDGDVCGPDGCAPEPTQP
jgi:predicted DsbA family dithiol-disulfide isomerase